MGKMMKECDASAVPFRTKSWSPKSNTLPMQMVQCMIVDITTKLNCFQRHDCNGVELFLATILHISLAALVLLAHTLSIFFLPLHFNRSPFDLSISHDTSGKNPYKIKKYTPIAA
mmetsp:Transcript_23865/g.30055  ORF Transcript_23865/g.30055 Transcript_23865/m.30055 type:complete len:115 (-) Transcript_23865:775-1119(-)